MELQPIYVIAFRLAKSALRPVTPLAKPGAQPSEHLGDGSVGLGPAIGLR